MSRANAPAGLQVERRTAHVPLRIDGERISLRDQRPLHAANVGFEDGWTFEDLLRALNGRVFFWPGTDDGPRDHGRRHFERYRGEGPVLIRVRTSELVAANGSLAPAFCPFNSGSPRFSGGRPSPRGPSTFTTASEFVRSAADVVELTFANGVALPSAWEHGFAPSGPWTTV